MKRGEIICFRFFWARKKQGPALFDCTFGNRYNFLKNSFGESVLPLFLLSPKDVPSALLSLDWIGNRLMSESVLYDVSRTNSKLAVWKAYLAPHGKGHISSLREKKSSRLTLPAENNYSTHVDCYLHTYRGFLPMSCSFFQSLRSHQDKTTLLKSFQCLKFDKDHRRFQNLCLFPCRCGDWQGTQIQLSTFRPEFGQLFVPLDLASLRAGTIWQTDHQLLECIYTPRHGPITSSDTCQEDCLDC